MIEPGGDDDVEEEAGDVPVVRSRRPKNVMRAAVVIALVVVTGFLVYYRATYGTFAWWQPPGRIDFCGREYLRGSTVSGISPEDWSLTPATTVLPMWWQVYEKQPRADSGVDPRIPGLPCAMGLVVRLHDGDYIQYGLSGGP